MLCEMVCCSFAQFFEVTASLAFESVPKTVKKKVVISAKAELELFFHLADPKSSNARM